MHDETTRETSEWRKCRRLNAHRVLLAVALFALGSSVAIGCVQPASSDDASEPSSDEALVRRCRKDCDAGTTSLGNLALNRPVTASSVEEAGLEAVYAVDGNGATRWSSAYSDPQWIRVDLGATYSLSRVKINWETAYASGFKVQVSNDGNTFTDIYSTTSNTSLSNDLTSLPANSGRYLRIYGTARATIYGYSIYELEAYGAPANTGGDTTAPTAPGGLSASNVSDTGATLTWSAASDNVGVAGYRLYANGARVSQTSALSYTFGGLACGTSNTLGVATYDAAGNASAISTLAVSTAACSSTGVQPLGVGGSWTLAFDDEFDGTSLDLSKWHNVWYCEGCVQNNVPTYSSNVAVANGNLVLTLASATSGASVHTGDETGRYRLPVGGYTEARVFFPGSSTEPIYNWPAWWVSGPNWPAAGEHDIAEGLGGELTVNYHSPSGAHNQGTVPGNWGSAFHVYGVHRKASSADVYWDGVLVKSYPTDDNGAPEQLIVNVGASGSRTAHTGTEGQVKVDYVRAWQP